MKNSTSVMIHHEMLAGPIAADGASVSITRMAHTVNRVMSNPCSTFLKPCVSFILCLDLR